MHATRANLYYVGIAFDEINACFVQSFGNNFQPVGFADVFKYFQAVFAKTLERVRRRPRFEGTAAEKLRATSPHGFGNHKRLIAGFNRARARNDCQFLATGRLVPNLRHGLLGPEIQGNEFIRLTNANGLRNTWQIFKVGGVDGAGITSDTDGIIRQLVKASVSGESPDEVNLAFMISMVKSIKPRIASRPCWWRRWFRFM